MLVFLFKVGKFFSLVKIFIKGLKYCKRIILITYIAIVVICVKSEIEIFYLDIRLNSDHLTKLHTRVK